MSRGAPTPHRPNRWARAGVRSRRLESSVRNLLCVSVHHLSLEPRHAWTITMTSEVQARQGRLVRFSQLGNVLPQAFVLLRSPIDDVPPLPSTALDREMALVTLVVTRCMAFMEIFWDFLLKKMSRFLDKCFHFFCCRWIRVKLNGNKIGKC